MTVSNGKTELERQIGKKLKFWRSKEMSEPYYPLDEIMALVEQEIAKAQWQLINRIEESCSQHTVPEGMGLMTKAYLKNTLEFERSRLRTKQERPRKEE